MQAYDRYMHSEAHPGIIRNVLRSVLTDVKWIS